VRGLPRILLQLEGSGAKGRLYGPASFNRLPRTNFENNVLRLSLDAVQYSFLLRNADSVSDSVYA
jgi:hypothetical protein